MTILNQLSFFTLWVISMPVSSRLIHLDQRSNLNIYNLHRESYIQATDALLNAVNHQIQAIHPYQQEFERRHGNCFAATRTFDLQAKAACLVGVKVETKSAFVQRPTMTQFWRIRSKRMITRLVVKPEEDQIDWLSKALPVDLPKRHETFNTQMERLDRLTNGLREQLIDQNGHSTSAQMKLFQAVAKLVGGNSNLHVLSPRFLPITSPENGTQLWSPDILSLRDGAADNSMSWNSVLRTLGITPPNWREYMKWTLLHLSGTHSKVRSIVDWLDSRPINEQEALVKTHLLTTEAMGNVTDSNLLMTGTQHKQLTKFGYAIMNDAQMETIYGERSPIGSQLHDRYRREWKKYGASTMFKRQLLRMAFNRRQQDPAIFKPGILKPGVLGAAILSPSLFSPSILSPGALKAAILSPSIGNPSILSPGVLIASVLSPTLLSPAILSPGVLKPAILSPFGLSPAILSPRVLSPGILVPNFLSPAILSPVALSPGILSPGILGGKVLSPSILS